MDADEQRPTPEQANVAATSEATASTRSEAASRAAHPSSRAPRGTLTRPHTQTEAVHYEDAAVRWLAAHGARLDTWPADHAARGIVLDGLRDLALLMGQRLRSDPRPLTDDYSTILATLCDVAGRADTRQLLRQDPRALLPLVAVQATLRENGQADPCLAQALEAELAERSVPGLARTAQDQIALHYLLPRARMSLPCPHLTSLLATSLLADDVVALELTRPDVEGIIRIVTTASDFGSTEIPWPAGATPAGVAGVLHEWLVLAMADEDAELVGNLLVGLTCLETFPHELTWTARRWLHGWQESDGRVEGTNARTEPAVADEPGWADWAEALRATVMTALDGLLLRTFAGAAGRPAAVLPENDPAADPSAADLAESIMAAADWLDAVLPGTHVQGRLWLSEAWLALGDEDEARRQLLRLAEDPHIAFTVLKQSGELAVHLAALVVVLGVASPPLTDLCEDVAALLTHPEAAQVLLGPARARAGTTGAHPDEGPDLSSAHAELRRRSVALCVQLLRDGSRSDPTSPTGLGELALLARSTRAAAAAGDLGWLALVLRGLHRLELVPERLVRDATAFLRSQQRPDGAIGPRPEGDCSATDRQVRWTLQSLQALVEAIRDAGAATS